MWHYFFRLLALSCLILLASERISAFCLYPVAFELQDIDRGNKVPREIFERQYHNSLTFSGNIFTSTVWTLGGQDGNVLLFAASYTRTISSQIALSLQVRYMSTFIDRSNFLTPGLNWRWLNSVWGTDILVKFYPYKELLPGLSLGIGSSLDIGSSFQTKYTSTHPNTTSTLRSADVFSAHYLGGIACSEYTFFSLTNGVDIGASLQVYAQQILTPRPYFPISSSLSGGVLYGVYIRTNW